MSEVKKDRLYFLDWLRVLAFALLILYHAGLIFVDWGYHIQNDELSENLKLPMLFLNHWRLPLLFFISGVGVSFSFKKRTTSKYLTERFNRLFVPLVAGIIFIVPIQVYYERLYHNKFEGSYFDFFPQFFYGIYPQGNFMWGHLWFLVYLIAFILIALPLFNFIRQKENSPALNRINGFLQRKGVLLVILSIPIIIARLTLRESWPDNRNLISDWYNLSVYIIFFVYGYYIAQVQSLWVSIKQQRWGYLIIGIISFLVIYLGNHQSGINFLEKNQVGYYTFEILTMINIVAWMLCCLAFGMAYLNRNSKHLSYANQAVYPVFILHQSILIMAGYYVLDLEFNLFVKLILITLITFGGSSLINHYFVLPFKVTRVLFGVKPLSRGEVHSIYPKTRQHL